MSNQGADCGGCGGCGTCCSSFYRVTRAIMFWGLPFALGTVMAGFATAAILDRDTAMVTFGGFRWMLMTALIYEFLLFIWALVESGVKGFKQRDLNCEMSVHLMLAVLWVFPFSIYQITWHENKYQTDANWRSAWDVALVFSIVGSFIPGLVRALIGAADCSSSSSQSGYSKITPTRNPF